ALLYKSQGKYSEAEPLYKEAIAIDRIALPENHPDLATDLSNLAALYFSQGKYSEAEPLLDEAIAIDRIALPPNHPSLATHLSNLAALYFSQGKYSEAEPLLDEAIAIDRIALPENHPSLATHLNNLGLLYRSQGKYSEAFEQFQASLKSENLRLRYIFSTSSDRERREYLQQNPETYYLFLTLVWQHLRDDPQAVGAALDAVLGRKALSTAALAAQNAAIYSGRYSEAIQNIFRDLQQCNEEILEATYAPPPKPELSPEAYEQQRKERRQGLADLQKESENLEKQLAKEIPELQLSHQKVNRDLVAAQLPDGSALVEFVRFQRQSVGALKGEKWQQERYLAFVVMAHQPEQVRLVDLGEAEPLDKLIKAFRSQFVSKEDDMGMTGSSASVPAAPSPTEQLHHALYHVLCQPLITALPSGCHCFLAPDSTLNLLPFQILPIAQNKNNDVDYSAFQITEPQTQYVCRGDSRIAPTGGRGLLNRKALYFSDQYRISYLNSGRDLLRQEIRERPLKVCSAIILADPDYDWHGTEAGEQRSRGAGEQGSRGAEVQGDCRGNAPVLAPEQVSKGENLTLSAISGFGRAQGTDTFGTRAGELLGVQPYLRENAVSRHLTHGDCPRVLAVATHGFYRTAEKPYVELIFRLLKTEPGTETQLFKQNAALMNSQLFDKLKKITKYFETENPQIAQKLRDLAPKIEDYIAKQPPSRLDVVDPNSPMYRGGIALAGANVWNQGGTLPNGNKGILFAQDVAALDLWGNELSALIACQTGLGEVASGDTVGGLRRAFVVSGSKTQVMSLWSVPARATCYLMERFFHHLNAGLGRAEALARAQFEVRTVTAGTLRQSDLGREILQELTWDYKDEDCPLSDPYYWGAWVLQGDISPLAVKLYGDMV
ncbi:CHAT domain-containing protein, partial [Planktothricoides raciborskii]